MSGLFVLTLGQRVSCGGVVVGPQGSHGSTAGRNFHHCWYTYSE